MCVEPSVLLDRARTAGCSVREVSRWLDRRKSRIAASYTQEKNTFNFNMLKCNIVAIAPVFITHYPTRQISGRQYPHRVSVRTCLSAHTPPQLLNPSRHTTGKRTIFKLICRRELDTDVKANGIAREFDGFDEG
jgi:hypothetical protein